MKTLFRLPICCFLFFLAANMTGCGGSPPDQQPAVSKIAVKPAGPQEGKPGENPEAGKPAVTQEEPATDPEENQPGKPEANEPAVTQEEPATDPEENQPGKPEASEVIGAKKKATEPPSDDQLKEAAKALTEVAKDGVVKKNVPKPKLSQADNLPVVELTVNQNEWVEHNTGMGGDEQGVKFMVYSKHQQNCSILRDKTTGHEPVFRYRSKVGYVGKDSVELEYSDHQPGSGPDDPGTTTKTRQVINITVVAKEKK